MQTVSVSSSLTLRKKATGNRIIKFTSLEETQSPFSSFLSAESRVYDAVFTDWPWRPIEHVQNCPSAAVMKVSHGLLYVCVNCQTVELVHYTLQGSHY